MTYNPDKHHRKSIRLKGYDYSQAGMYFITMCVQDRAHLLGEIDVGVDPCVNPKITDDPVGVDPRNPIIADEPPRPFKPNRAGLMIDKWWQKIPEKFPDIELGVYQTMPNHFHGIIINNGTGNVGVDPRVNPIILSDEHMGLSQPGSPQPGSSQSMGEHMGSPLRRVIQWFKTMTTNEYIRGVKSNPCICSSNTKCICGGWQPFNDRLWQRNYWEHIIRNDASYYKISEYIINNPAKWADDSLYSETP